MSSAKRMGHGASRKVLVVSVPRYVSWATAVLVRRMDLFMNFFLGLAFTDRSVGQRPRPGPSMDKGAIKDLRRFLESAGIVP